jgi:DHA1 family multidrug/chloramphenicol efflux transport protein-like MFS transporter
MNKQNSSLLFPIVLVFYELILYMANDMYLPSLPSLVKDLAITQDLAQYTLTLWFLGTASLQLIIGPCSDRYGRKKVLLIGAYCFTIASMICALTHNFIWLLAARFIQGAAVCSIGVAGYAAIHELYDSKTAIKIISLMASITILGPALGPLVGAIILKIANWRYIFIALGISGFLSILQLSKVMPETNKQKTVINFKETISDYLTITFRREFLAYTLTLCFSFISFIIWIVESPFIIIESHQQTEIYYGIIQLVIFSFFIIGTQITRYLLRKTSTLNIISLGLFLSLLGALLLLGSSFAAQLSLNLVALSMSLVALGSAIASGPLSRGAIDACQEPMGRVMAISSTFMGIFGVLGTFVINIFQYKNIQNLAYVIIICMTLSYLIFYFARTKQVVKAAI